MFLTKQELLQIYEKIEQGIATESEVEDFEFNLMTCSLEREFVIEELKCMKRQLDVNNKRRD